VEAGERIMVNRFDISNMSVDEIDNAVGNYNPYDPNEQALFEPHNKEPLPESLSADEMGSGGTAPQETLSTEEIFSAPKMRKLDKMWLALDKPVSVVEKTQKAIGKSAIGKGMWKALGVLSWPFERIEAGIATPATSLIKTLGPLGSIGADAETQLLTNTPLAKHVFKNQIRSMITPYGKKVAGENLEAMLDDAADGVANGILTPEKVYSDLTEAKSTLPELLPSFLRGAKSFVPFTRNNPEKVKNFNDFWGAYYETMTGEQMPEVLKQTAGAGTSFLTTPFVFGKLLRGLRAGAKEIPLVQKMLANSLPEWKEAKLIRKANIYERNERAANAGKLLADKEAKRIAVQLSRQSGKTITPEAVKLRLGQIIKGSITENAALGEQAHPAIEELQANFKTLQELGLLSEETYLTKLTKARVAELTSEKASLTKSLTRLQTAPHYVGTQEISGKFPGRADKIRGLEEQIKAIDDTLWQSKLHGGESYMPRMYTTKEAAAAERKFPVSGGPKVKAPYAKGRENIPMAVRKEMGEILEPAYPVTKRLIQESQDIETSKLFNFVAQKGEWVDDVWREGLSVKPLPDTKTYGSLAGKFVHPKIYNDITELTRIRSDFESLYDSLIGTWKMGKVTLNPSTHFRNTISNSILLDLSGTGHVEQSRLFVKALGEMKAGSEEFQNAKKFFRSGTMISGEVLDDMLRTVSKDKASGIQKTINTWNTVFGKATAPASAVYQQEEFTFKFMKYLEQREQGKSIMGAVQEANKWLFDYSDLSRFEKVVARRVMPFYTFPRKALPRVLEAATDRPLTLAKYPLLAWTEQKYALHKLDLTDKDYEDIQKVLPEYMKSGSYLLMPFRNANGDLLFFDWTYIIPWGELYDAQDNKLLGDVITNPLVQITADIARNKSGWSGREIWNDTDTTEEQNFKKMLYVWQAAVPSLMYKGIYWDKLYNAATGRPSKMGEIQPLAPAIAHTIFGLRTQAIDVEQQKLFRMIEKQKSVQELEGKIRDIVIREANGNIDEEEYTKKRDQYIQQIQGLLSEDGESRKGQE
jgi:hypothetical protein